MQEKKIRQRELLTNVNNDYYCLYLESLISNDIRIMWLNNNESLVSDATILIYI